MRIIVAILLCTIAWSATAADFTRGLLWKVERPGAAPSHVLGTIHLPDPRVARPSPGALRAIGTAQVVLTEIALDAKGYAAAAQLITLPPDQSLRGLIGTRDFDALAALMEKRGMPAMMIDRLRPFGAMSLLVLPGNGSEKPLDLQIWEAGQRAGAKTLGLETVVEQLRAFDAIGPADQAELLRELVRQHAKIPQMLEEIVELYLAADIAGMLSIMSRGTPDMPANTALANRMKVAVIDERNDRMVTRMIPYLDRGGAFVAVGAAHLAGERGVLAQLAKRGYRVSREQKQ